MRSLVGPVPEPAERVSSALRRCPRATLGLLSATSGSSSVAAMPAPEVTLVHQVPGTADLWVALPTAHAGAIGVGGATARLEVLDEIIGGAAEGRCRRIVVVEGRVELPGVRAQRRTAGEIARDLPDTVLLDVGTGVALVRLRAERIVLTDDDGVTDIDPEDLATSGPDPFSDLEGHWLAHLNDPRCQVVPRMALRVCRCLPAERPLLVGIDRAGVDIELVGRDGRIRRERLPFAEACVGVTELGTQLRLLAGGSRYPLDRAALRP
ncbi:hypothetical protein G6019_14985 [Dietzia sp. DQ12-76]|uniref:hypothetical protein n=1 Tax=unclassified Dietzia TaxID=2617939 RepID=UPI0015FC7558|nr:MULTISPECIES: hypothetical protein [unclassified Dietzia]MBB1025707.1 hypothetical protein [Dietzia sp. DQ12-76]MBB1027402.1 hypothetical protein [Dietzia sp. DQ11-38-2]